MLYFCRSIYSVEPPSHINPLILQKHRKGKVLVLIPREQHKQRILDVADQYDDMNIACVGWWELDDYDIVNEGYLNTKLLESFDAVVIVDYDRIDEQFNTMYQTVLELLT